MSRTLQITNNHVNISICHGRHILDNLQNVCMDSSFGIPNLSLTEQIPGRLTELDTQHFILSSNICKTSPVCVKNHNGRANSINIDEVNMLQLEEHKVKGVDILPNISYLGHLIAISTSTFMSLLYNLSLYPCRR